MLLATLFIACLESTKEPAFESHCVDQPESIAMDDERGGVSFENLLPNTPTGQSQFLYEGESRCARWHLLIDPNSVTHVQSTAVESNHSHDTSLSCSDYMTVQATLRLRSPDGLFDEDISLSLYHSLADDRENGLHFYQELPVSALQGSLKPTDFYNEERSKADRLTFDGSVGTDHFRAYLHIYAEDENTTHAFLEEIVSFERSCG
ncbi:MAG: hypothetical protein VX278_13830 [Myxococcota bacterium]|nr:hypothetical protein [Myxococcota bacterium]